MEITLTCTGKSSGKKTHREESASTIPFESDEESVVMGISGPHSPKLASLPVYGGIREQPSMPAGTPKINLPPADRPRM